jgi:hypothetical protein
VPPAVRSEGGRVPRTLDGEEEEGALAVLHPAQVIPHVEVDQPHHQRQENRLRQLALQARSAQVDPYSTQFKPDQCRACCMACVAVHRHLVARPHRCSTRDR